MKFLSFLVLFSFAAYANTDISKFKGQIFKKANYDLCLNEYDVVTKNVDSVEGYTVLSGGCLEVGKETFQIQFDYMHPLAGSVENYNYTLANEASCLNFAKNAAKEITASGNTFVSSYCSGKELNTHFIDTTYSVVRSFNRLGKFFTEADCLNFVAELTSKAAAFKMTSFVSTCNEVKYDMSGKSYFSPVFNYISFYDIEMGLINGKTVSTASDCAKNRVNVEQNFSANQIKIVYSYCPGQMSYEQNLQETILYIKPKNGKYIAEYEGVLFNAAEACESSLNAVMAGLERSGQGVLYGFCKKLNDKNFKPVVTYIKTIEL